MKEERKLKDILATLSNRKVLLFDKFGVTELAVFGSYARSQQTDASDVDIYVELKKEFKTFDNFMDLKFFLEDLLESRKIDLVTKESIREEFRPKIFEEAVHV
ncbi:MAG: nucleotidyltransferase [Candidatus Aminicenantes bacterium]|nr:nucleotidyltransferase [Candidatus Aminicenantes bacterium]NIM77352.1 nucleotidyltransferase [Candidatus Aminicenantes bacterium]NIN16650.1 nucleotidyltransferase [Candidatus Aminicenantes bacterium]NIN40508.1 nucleotidyltransferase [Candidatus Aminicenantes bacterium]NIN83328.1 nucleotidyltransferase [Candidatus Aminicenantes bacterium]